MRNPDTYQFEQSYDMVTCFGTLHFWLRVSGNDL